MKYEEIEKFMELKGISPRKMFSNIYTENKHRNRRISDGYLSII